MNPKWTTMAQREHRAGGPREGGKGGGPLAPAPLTSFLPEAVQCVPPARQSLLHAQAESRPLAGWQPLRIQGNTLTFVV